MNEAEQIPRQDVIDVPQLARAIRFALVAIVLGLSYFSIRISLSIGSFSSIYTDMLSGGPLPVLTTFILSARPLFVVVSVLVPIAAVATLFLRCVVRSFYIIGVLGFLTIAQFITLSHGLTAPLTRIFSDMSSGPTP